MSEEQKPRIKAMCLFVHNGKVLASKGYDENKDETFYRVIGDSVEFGEKTNDAIKREAREELLCDIENLELVKVVENIFVFNGKQRHDIVFLYKGNLSNKDLYEKEKFISFNHILSLMLSG